MNQYDVSWMDLDASEGENNVRIKSIEVRPGNQARPRQRGMDSADLDPSFEVGISRHTCTKKHLT